MNSQAFMNETIRHTLSALRRMIPMLGLCCIAISSAHAATASYSTYTSWDAMHKATASKYTPVTRISENDGKATGFWFFGMEQFDKTGRYALGHYVFERSVIRINQPKPT